MFNVKKAITVKLNGKVWTVVAFSRDGQLWCWPAGEFDTVKTAATARLEEVVNPKIGIGRFFPQRRRLPGVI